MPKSMLKPFDEVHREANYSLSVLSHPYACMSDVPSCTDV
jgi:hypothetical protein